MKLIKLTALLALAVALSVGATGCKKKPTNVTPLPGSRTGKVGGGTTPITDSTGGIGSGTAGVESSGGGIPAADLAGFDGTPDRAALAAQTVHFAYDSSALKTSEQGKVDAVAAELKANPMNKLLIEGHCDERGTEGYNLSLGERRALSLREALAAQGVSPERVRTMSLGEAVPAVDGHDESAWAMNRRGEFVLIRPKP